MTRTGIARAARLLGPLIVLAMAAQADAAEIGRPQDRPDRLISARVDHDDPPAEGADEPVFLGALKAWARAGHVDRVMVNVYKKLAPTTPLRHYVQALEGTSTELWGDLYWGTWPQPDGGPMKDLAIARGWVGQGLNGGFFYYMRARPIEWESINWQLRLVDVPDVFVDPHYRFE